MVKVSHLALLVSLFFLINSSSATTTKMEKQLLCPNTTSSSEAKYSAPVPFIGLYIAAASLVCFLLILSDVIQGFRLRKRWFPCRFFSLDSASLTLLAVAAKIPVDLTTEMPTAQDQLSKLTGVALVCVCMGVMFPSLGGKKDNECFTNMVALSIFVVTIIVNICIQMSTGLISTFFPEHIIMMYCMSIMILSLWGSTILVSPYKRYHMTIRTDLLTKGEGTMFRQLQLCDVHSNGKNPQFTLCESGASAVASYVCLTSLVIVLQASFRARIISQEFWDNKGCSDYGWSMRIIIGAQILAILLATITAAFRFLVVSHLNGSITGFGYGLISSETNELFFPILIWVSRPYLKAGVVDYVRFIVTYIVFLVLEIHNRVLSCVGYCVRICVRSILMVLDIVSALPGEHKNLMKEETNFQEIIEHSDLYFKCLKWRLKKRTIAKCLNDMKRRMALSGNPNIVSRVSEILSRTPPCRRCCDFKDDELSCRTLVFLARVASALTPSTLNAHLTQCLSEVFDLICFVDKKMHFSGAQTKLKFKHAKAMWLGKDFTTIISKMGTRERRARDIITELKKVISTDVVEAEIGLIVRYASFVRVHGYSVTGEELHGHSTTGKELCEGVTEEDLCRAIQQLFVVILHIFLSQLPRAIYKHVSECPVEDYQDNVRLALKFLCQVQCLEGKIEWSYPDGCHFSGIITSRLPAESSIIRSSQMSGECAHLPAIEYETQLACNIGCDEITLVE